jgi:hypothetical protein
MESTRHKYECETRTSNRICISSIGSTSTSISTSTSASTSANTSGSAGGSLQRTSMYGHSRRAQNPTEL